MKAGKRVMRYRVGAAFYLRTVDQSTGCSIAVWEYGATVLRSAAPFTPSGAVGAISPPEVAGVVFPDTDGDADGVSADVGSGVPTLGSAGTRETLVSVPDPLPPPTGDVAVVRDAATATN